MRLMPFAWVAALGCACQPASSDMRNVTASVVALRGRFGVDVEVNGAQGVATSVWINLVPSPEMYKEHRQCPVWDHQSVYLEHERLKTERTGGVVFGVGGTRGFCEQGIFSLRIEVADWEARDELEVRIVDDSGESHFVFENFIRAPRITVVEPEDAHVRRSQRFVLHFAPSTAMLPAFSMVARGDRSWGGFYMEDVRIDAYRAGFTVPADATLGATTLRFDSGNHPAAFGFQAGVLACEDAVRCQARRVSGGGLALPSDELDDDWVQVELVVEE